MIELEQCCKCGVIDFIDNLGMTEFNGKEIGVMCKECFEEFADEVLLDISQKCYGCEHRFYCMN